eukprot:6011641-Pyramimonas_sp.AAC.1
MSTWDIWSVSRIECVTTKRVVGRSSSGAVCQLQLELQSDTVTVTGSYSYSHRSQLPESVTGASHR